MLSEEQLSRAELAHKLGLSRARVTQVLGLLALDRDVLEAVETLGDPLSRSVVSVRMLRSLLKLSPAEQQSFLQESVWATAHSQSCHRGHRYQSKCHECQDQC